jgi:MFS transporter, DHA1 family, multidrug resistance protein
MVNLATVLLPMILFSVGLGASGPAAITSAIVTDPRMIGAASDLHGFMQMANGALCTSSANISSSAPPARGPARAHDPLLSGAATLANRRSDERTSAPWPGQL